MRDINFLSDNLAKNLKFFEKKYPQLFQMYSGYSPKKYKLHYDPTSDDFNLLLDGVAVYNFGMEQHYKESARDFLSEVSEKSVVRTFALPTKNDFNPNRFFYGHLHRYMDKINPSDKVRNRYLVGSRIPLLVFFGVESGLHVDEILNHREVDQIVFVEKDPELFYYSLMFVDWGKICGKFLNVRNKAISFIIFGGDSRVSESNVQNILHNDLWNQLYFRVPIYPLMTFSVFSGLSTDFYKGILQSVKDKLIAHVTSWGYYDDDINQINQFFHNARQSPRILRANAVKPTDRWAIICGNGPSLDDAAEFIRSNRDKLFVVAACSALHTLVNHGIKPDLAVSLESDYSTLSAFKLMPADKIRDVPFVGALQIHPGTFELFNHSACYLGSETSFLSLLNGELDIVHGDRPTATNSAFSVTCTLGFKKLILTGLDYGYVEGDRHHSKKSFYYDGSANENLNKVARGIEEKSYFKEENVHGRIYTTTVFDSAKQRLEQAVAHYRPNVVLNFSKGLTIKNARFVDLGLLEEVMSEATVNDVDVKSVLSSFEEFDGSIISSYENQIIDFIRESSNKILSVVRNVTATEESVYEAIVKFHTILPQTAERARQQPFFLIRGVLWWYSLALYGSIKSVDELDIECLVDEWKKSLEKLCTQWSTHAEFFLSDLSNDDPRLGLTINDPEPDWQLFFR
ncbi:motility associated factor glycosyltransferase family protein [Salinibius halmophilus]|uniref:motility associated factor glycosyltransferase family protein n=1 Tax=Salinibius halmophilus TaxID=1853216 RepID=UPI000E670C1D|nr:6-hydroxymethylpterin diphosphokinase MptE-like protein [Salinibius halmophilus]